MTDPTLEDVTDAPDDPATDLVDDPEPMMAGEDTAETDPEAEVAAGTEPTNVDN